MKGRKFMAGHGFIKAYGFVLIRDDIIADVHRQVNEHRASLGLEPWDFKQRPVSLYTNAKNSRAEKSVVLAYDEKWKIVSLTGKPMAKAAKSGT